MSQRGGGTVFPGWDLPPCPALTQLWVKLPKQYWLPRHMWLAEVLSGTSSPLKLHRKNEQVLSGWWLWDLVYSSRKKSVRSNSRLYQSNHLQWLQSLSLSSGSLSHLLLPSSPWGNWTQGKASPSLESESESCSVMSDSLKPHELYRLNSGLNSPGQNTAVVAFPFSRGSSQPRSWTQVSCIAGRFFTNWPITYLTVISTSSFPHPTWFSGRQWRGAFGEKQERCFSGPHTRQQGNQGWQGYQLGSEQYSTQISHLGPH